MVSTMASKKILILRLSAAGDVIRTLPSIKSLKEHHPSVSITWIVEEPSYVFLKSQPEIDRVILFPRKRWVKGIKSRRDLWGTIREMVNFVKDLRRQKFDIVLDFHGILKSGILSVLSGSSKRIGYERRSAKEGNYLFSNVKVKLPKEKISRFQRNLFLLRGIGVEVKNLQYRLTVPLEDQRPIELFFNTLSPPARRPLVAIHPGTSSKAIFKRWMPDQYTRLADRLVRELQATVIFTRGEEEFEWVETIRKEMKEPSLLAPETRSLTQLGEVYRRCDLYIGGDTGPMHIASLMGTPVAVIYGPTDPVENEPFGKHIKIRKEVGCNPCRNRSCKELKCLKAVQVDDVFKATKEILGITI
jgi:lipopolysaccharide heptosyltransferase I